MCEGLCEIGEVEGEGFSSVLGMKLGVSPITQKNAALLKAGFGVLLGLWAVTV